MKDLPHHIKKLNRRVIRSVHREEQQELPDIPVWPESERQKKKKAKIRVKQEKRSHPSTTPTPEERNQTMKKGRVPGFDRINNNTPKHARATKKKTPRI